MKKIIYGILVTISLVVSSCVSLAKYNQLEHKYYAETSRLSFENMQLDAGERLCRKHFKSTFERNKTLDKKIEVHEKILERELQKSIKQENQHQSRCSKDISDSRGVYISFSSLDSAVTATEALVRAYTNVQNSIKLTLDSIIYVAIDRYSKERNVPFDTINTDRLWNQISHSICHDVWVDSTNTYWAMEVQRVYWAEFIDVYITETMKEEAFIEESIKELDGEDTEFTKKWVNELKEKANRKLDTELFKEILNTIIKKTEDAETPS